MRGVSTPALGDSVKGLYIQELCDARNSLLPATRVSIASGGSLGPWSDARRYCRLAGRRGVDSAALPEGAVEPRTLESRTAPQGGRTQITGGWRFRA